MSALPTTEKQPGKDLSIEGTKKPRLRSPAYPGINLDTAIKRARTFYSKERRNSANVAVAVQHWDFKPTSGGGFIVIAAMKSFGLMVEDGAGAGRTVKLSELALRILLDEREVSPEREAAIKIAALSPKIHAQLWKKHGPDLPSEGNLRHELIFGMKFNENSVDDFIKKYKDTIAFAKLTSSDSISLGLEDKRHDESEGDGDTESHPALEVGTYVQWESNGQLRFKEPKRVRRVSEDGEWAFVDESTTGLPVGELTVMETPAAKPELKAPPVLPLPPPAVLAKDSHSDAANKRQDVFSLAEGPVTIQWPASLSPESFEDLRDWLDIVKRKIGRSVKTGQE